MLRRTTKAIALATALSAGPAMAGTPPPGFVEETIEATIPQITAFDWSPSGDLYILSKPGTVHRLPAGATLAQTLGSVNVTSSDDGGLLGLALDPSFPANGWIYIYYTVPTTPAHNRVSRFTVSGAALGGEVVLLELPPLVKVFHYAGHLRFDRSGRLLISVGDNGQPAMAQDKGSLLGKILRINPDGSIPPDNPFLGDPAARPEIWALGVRNPWRFSIDPGTDTLFIGDVGDGSYEELDLGIAGANYGYPLTEGPQPPGVAGVTYPIYSYPHAGTSAAITAGDHMVAGNFPPQYEGSYFFGDSSRGTLTEMVLDSSLIPVRVTEFLTGADRPVHIRTGPDGALWYATIFPSAIRRVHWVGGANSQPVPIAEAAPMTGTAPLVVDFDASASSDPDGDPLTFTWTFGDGGFFSGVTARHTYPNPGVFNARLIASDGATQRDTFLRIVSGNASPTASIHSPAAGSPFVAGQTISFSGSGADPEEGALSPAGLSWTVVFHHNTHIHPYLGPQSGLASGSFTIANTGEPDPDVWYELILTATDTGAPLGAAGATSNTVSIPLLPIPASLELRTEPIAGLSLALDAHSVTAPHTVAGIAGFLRDVAAPSPQTPGDGHTYSFQGWSDGGAASHTVALPAGSGELTATFGCNLLEEVQGLRVTAASGGSLTLSWDPVSDPCLKIGPRYRVWASSSKVPTTPPGSFPADPPFSLAATTFDTSVTLAVKPGIQFFLVEGIGSDGNGGPVGHYGR